MNYRDAIVAICNRVARPGDDLEAALLEGAPAVITADVARGIARWLETSADSTWGPDERHALMAAEIRDLINR